MAGVVPHKEDVNQFVQDMKSVRLSYHLNALGPDWHCVQGDWSPVTVTGDPLAHDCQELRNRIRGLMDRTRHKFQRRSNYTEIGRVKQKEDEPFEEYRVRMTTTFKTHSGLEDNGNPNGPFQQQLKNALHAGSRDAVRCWVSKHYIGLPTGTLEEYVNHALHAEKVVKEDRKTAGVFLSKP